MFMQSGNRKRRDLPDPRFPDINDALRSVVAPFNEGTQSLEDTVRAAETWWISFNARARKDLFQDRALVWLVNYPFQLGTVTARLNMAPPSVSAWTLLQEILNAPDPVISDTFKQDVDMILALEYAGRFLQNVRGIQQSPVVAAPAPAPTIPIQLAPPAPLLGAPPSGPHPALHPPALAPMLQQPAGPAPFVQQAPWPPSGPAPQLGPPLPFAALLGPPSSAAAPAPPPPPAAHSDSARLARASETGEAAGPGRSVRAPSREGRGNGAMSIRWRSRSPRSPSYERRREPRSRSRSRGAGARSMSRSQSRDRKRDKKDKKKKKSSKDKKASRKRKRDAFTLTYICLYCS